MRFKKVDPFQLMVFGTLLFLLILLFFYCTTMYEIKDSFSNRLRNDSGQPMKKIIFIPPQSDYPVWLQAKRGFEDAAKDFNFYGKWVEGKNLNITNMVNELDMTLESKPDAVITCPLNPHEFSGSFLKYKEAGIPLITIAVDAANSNERTAFIGSNAEMMGFEQARNLYEKDNIPLNIGVIMSNLDTANQVKQVDALKMYIEDKPGSNIVCIEEDWGDPITAMEVMEDMLDRYPEINAIFNTSGGGSVGCAKVLKERSKEKSITYIGVDTTSENLELIKENCIYGVMHQDYYMMGYLSGKYAYQSSMGEEVPPITYTETPIVTLENYDHFLPAIGKEDKSHD